MEAIARFEAKYVPEPMSGCWLWIGASDAKTGYGKFSEWKKRKTHNAHRFSYELYVGPVPDGAVLDHLCRTKLCVNPEHMEPTTQRTNVLRGLALKTECPQGHPYDEANTLWMKNPGQRNASKRCRICHAEQARRSYHKRQADQTA